MAEKINLKTVYATGALCAWGALLFALYSQYQLDLLPCAYCIVQRMVYVLLGIFFTFQWSGELIAASKSQISAAQQSVSWVKRFSSGLWLLILSIMGLFVGLYQFLFAKSEGNCGISWAQVLIDYTRLEQFAPVLFEVQTLCGENSAHLLGVPYELYSVAGFVFLAALSVIGLHLLWRKRGLSDA